VLDFLEGRNIIPPEKQAGADPYMVLYLMKNKKKIRPSRKDFTRFENAKYTFALTKDCSKEEVKLELYYKSKTMIGTANIPLISLLPFNTEHDKWIPIADSSKENHGEVHARLYLFPKKEKTTTKSVKYPTPYFKAVEECDLQLLMKCIDDPKINPNAQDADGWTALHHACNKWENEYLITMLLRNPAVRVDVVNVDGNTVLHTFCQKYKNPKCEEAFNMLIQRGANVNAKNSQRETPLHKAVINPRIRMILVELLIKAGAKVNESVKGGTPLHYAVQLSRTDLVTILVANGADLTVKDSRGDTPMDLCKQFKNEAVLRKLQEFMKLGEYLDSLGAGNLKRQFFQKQLFKWKLKGMTEQQLKKYGIEISAGQSLKLFAAFKEIEDTDPTKEEGSGHEDDKDAVVDPAKQRHLLDEMINKGEWKIDESALEFLQLLGTGSAGDVYKGRYTANVTEGGKTQKVTIPVAIKILKLSAGKELDAFQLEFKVISAIQSPYIVKLYGAVPSEKLKMVMEICTRGSLYGLLNSQQWHIGWEEFFIFAEQMFRGLIVIHTHKPQILHRDLKSLNVLVSEDWICKLCDFGLARFDTGGNMETLSKLRGTFAYSAPEVYFGERYSDKSDIYSMGILLWEMLYRVINQEYQRPYEEFPRLKLDWQIIHKTATENLRPTMPPSTPVPLATLIRQCIVKDQAGRPDAKEVLQELSQLHAQYRHSRSEWDAAIVGTKVGQAIAFPESSKPDLFASTTSSASLIPSGTSAAVAATLSSQEAGEIVVEQVGDSSSSTLASTLSGGVAASATAVVNDNGAAHGMATGSESSPASTEQSTEAEAKKEKDGEEHKKEGEEHHHHKHHHEHKESEK